MGKLLNRLIPRKSASFEDSARKIRQTKEIVETAGEHGKTSNTAPAFKCQEKSTSYVDL